MTPEALARRLRAAWSARTATIWQPGNPALGQCGVTALVANDLLGGEIEKTAIGGAWHFYNRVAGARHDFTASQFEMPPAYQDLPSDREECMADTSPAQYAALRAALGAGGDGA